MQAKAATGDAYQPTMPLPLATGSGTTNPTTWCYGTQTTDRLLTTAGLFSRKYLLVTMTFKPDAAGSAAPTLHGWRHIYDCMPAQ